MEVKAQILELETGFFLLRSLCPPSVQMVIPGDPEEMRTFQSRTLALSRCSLELILPNAHIFLPSKEVYESIYNRWRHGVDRAG